MRLLPIHWTFLLYDYVHFALGGLYIILCLFSVAVVLRLILKGHWNLRWQKVFHPLFMSGCLVRAVFFILQPFLREKAIHMDNKINTILNTLPTFLFFSDYIIILFLWAEIYHYAHADSRVGIEKLKPIFSGLTTLMYGILCILYALNFLIYRETKILDVSVTVNPIERTIYIFGVSIYLMTSIGFLVYGLRIYFKFSSVPIYTRSRKKILRKIQVITLLVTLCFLIRSAVVILGVMVNLSLYWWFDGTYFMLLEVVPLLLMLHLLHGDSRRPRPTDYSENASLVNDSSER